MQCPETIQLLLITVRRSPGYTKRNPSPHHPSLNTTPHVHRRSYSNRLHPYPTIPIALFPSLYPTPPHSQFLIFLLHLLSIFKTPPILVDFLFFVLPSLSLAIHPHLVFVFVLLSLFVLLFLKIFIPDKEKKKERKKV